MSEGKKLNLYFPLVIKVVSELHSGPWAASGQPFLQELSRPRTLRFRSSYQTKAQRGDYAALPSSMSTTPWGSGATQGRSYPCGQSARPALPYRMTRVHLDPQHPTLTPAVHLLSPSSRDRVRDTNNEASPGPHFLPAVEAAGCAALHKAQKGWDLASTETQTLSSTKTEAGVHPECSWRHTALHASHTSAVALTLVLEGQLLFQSCISPHEPCSSFRFSLSSAHVPRKTEHILDLAAPSP